jgi:hypothetical protein
MPPLLKESSSEEEKSAALKWYEVRNYVKNLFGKRPDINAMLFLIGMNELGEAREEWTKEEKQDLMHVAICTLFQEDGYFVLKQRDEDGWPHYEPTEKLPAISLREQEDLLKKKIISYFENNNYI